MIEWWRASIESISLDGWIIIAGSLCAVSAALPGCFLVLRRLSLLGDAISHAVLPGLAVAFLVSGSRSSLPMLIGAIAVGLLTALLTELIRRHGNVDEGASMGVVFTSLFAIGLLMIVGAADHVDLDPGCVFYGSIELLEYDTWRVFGADVPRVVVVLAGVGLMNLLLIVLLFKEFKIGAFDPGLATTTGIHAGVMHYLLMAMVAVTAVASFESVGNILVVAMFIVPPATAYLLTDRLGVMLLLAAVVGIAAAVIGHVSAVAVPRFFGYASTSTAGMMAVAAGGLFTVAALLAPRHGVVVRLLRRTLLAQNILIEDVLGLLYRAAETTPEKGLTLDELSQRVIARRASVWLTTRWLAQRGLVVAAGKTIQLTTAGKTRAQALVRSHRLWEQYLTEQAGVASDRLHASAERLEHFTDQELRRQLDEETSTPSFDPHGRQIPPESERSD